MLTYRPEGLSPFKITVKLEKRVVGHIRRTIEGAYYYQPKSGPSGENFATVEQVKRSLES